MTSNSSTTKPSPLRPAAFETLRRPSSDTSIPSKAMLNQAIFLQLDFIFQGGINGSVNKAIDIIDKVWSLDRKGRKSYILDLGGNLSQTSGDGLPMGKLLDLERNPDIEKSNYKANRNSSFDKSSSKLRFR